MAWEGESEDAVLSGVGVSSLAVPDGAFTTTITVESAEDEVPRDITEDEIERAIREIRSAIDKTGGR